MNIFKRAVGFYRRMRIQPWIEDDRAACPRCGNRTWLVTVHPHWTRRRWLYGRREGLCKTCNLSVTQYFGISNCPSCGEASYLMIGTGGKIHPTDGFTRPPSYECVRCGLGRTK